MRTVSVGLLVILLFAPTANPAPITDPPLVEKYLHSGELARGEQALEQALTKKGEDDQLRFGLGFLRFVRATERLCQSLYEYGMRPTQTNLPFLRLPIPENPSPNTITHPIFRRILDDFRRDLALAENTLAGVTDDNVKLSLRLALVRLDLRGAGNATDSFLDLLGRYLGPGAGVLKANTGLRICFDRGDVAWLRGYCHLLMSMTDFMLAFDGKDLWEHSAHLCFIKPNTPLAGTDELPLNKLISALEKLPVREPDRLKRVRRHLLKVCALSRESWRHILFETDDENEFLPNPRQTGALGIRIRQEMIDSWLAMVGEAEAVLEGKKVIPFGFGNRDPEKGLNFKKFLEKPPEHVPVLEWALQGPNAYLEKGKMVDEAVWRRAERVFGGDFFGFAIWFN